MELSLETKPSNYQMPIFIIGMMFFAAVSCLGWIKLQYGFNFIDEGYHATESWRLAAGDHFLEDKITGTLQLYTLISTIIFKISPDVSLLQLRHIQFILTIASLLIFSIAFFQQSRQYTWLPFAFSLFAFTGLDPVGMISNLYYQTYPHLFLVLYLSFMLFGFQSENSTIRNFFYLLSGFCLWLISLSLLHLGVVVLSPIIILFLSRKLNLKDYPFSFNNLLYILSPFVVCWILFIAAFNKAYFLNLFNSVNIYLPNFTNASGLFYDNWVAIKYITISMTFLVLFFVSIKKLPVQFFLSACTILSLFIFLIINTPLFSFLIYYCNDWPSKPLWLSSLLIAFTVFFWIHISRKYFKKKLFTKQESLIIILMVPFTICSLTMSMFSTLGILSVAQNAIPGIAAISYMIMSQFKIAKYRHAVSCLILIMFLGPFYYATAQSDWNFTFFDVRPEQADFPIERGFGRGIYTNQFYSKLYDWLSANAKAFTQSDDFAISYIMSPMVHMITKLRPSLDDTFINSAKSIKYYEKCIIKMKQKGREPKIAFIFERQPTLFSVSSELGTMSFASKEFDFMSSQDPISIYIKTHMKPASVFNMSDHFIVRCYIDYNLPKHRKTGPRS